jgi:hypothetical protein
MDNSKVADRKKYKFYCQKCDYVTNKTSSWKKHIDTDKHKRLKWITEKLPKAKNNNTSIKFQCMCGRTYKYKSGLSKHKKKCQLKQINITEQQNINIKSSTPKEQELKDVLLQFMQSQAEFNNKITEELTKPKTEYKDCYNNKMTINVFLNEKCKNAMNLTDFVEQLSITMDDLDFTKNNGYIEGVTNILQKQLTDMEPTKRPIHCSDRKRLQFYVKEDNKWEKDDNNEKLDKTLQNIKMKQTMKISEWESANPNYRDDPKLLNEWQLMLAGVTEDPEGDIQKEKLVLKRKIASYIELKDAMGLK